MLVPGEDIYFINYVIVYYNRRVGASTVHQADLTYHRQNYWAKTTNFGFYVSDNAH